MSDATKLQSKIKIKLSRIFGNDLVKTEWDISRKATDTFRHRPAIYAPRLDLAVGPYNINRDTHQEGKNAIFTAANHPLIKYLDSIRGYDAINKNPRCLLAIEIEFSGSSKHILGGFINAGIMGYLGIIIGRTENEERISKISKYITAAQGLEKIPFTLFNNIMIFTERDFLSVLNRFVK